LRPLDHPGGDEIGTEHLDLIDLQAALGLRL
jgi:hypothetical protein